MNRRTFAGMVATAAASPVLRRAVDAQPSPKVRNVVLVHGLFADWSCWSEVIARLQPQGMSVHWPPDDHATRPIEAEAVAINAYSAEGRQ